MSGTRFRLYPQYDEGMEAEIVVVSSPAGSLGPGPSDRWMHVADPIHKLEPYDPPVTGPPAPGPLYAPALPGPGGHFDHLPPRTPQFHAAHLFGTVRHTLDVWDRYLNRPFRWWHADEYPSLELVPLVAWSNAQSGPGFLETGIWTAGVDQWQPFCLNHDIVAHECGHTLMFSIMGAQDPDRMAPQFLAFHESFSDLVALVAAMHFASVRNRLLTQTGGNLYVLNLVSRIGELSGHAQIRVASNTRVMADVADLSLNPDMSWHDPTGQGRNAHALAEPLTGAIFDVLVELYQDGLAIRGLIPPDDDPRGWTRQEVEQSIAAKRDRGLPAMTRFRRGFEAALLEARDAIGHGMAHVIDTLPVDEVAFATVAARFLEGLAQRGFGKLMGRLVGYFTQRGIDPAPFLRFRSVRSRPDRVSVAPAASLGCRCCRPGDIAATLRAMNHPHRENWTGLAKAGASRYRCAT